MTVVFWCFANCRLAYNVVKTQRPGVIFTDTCNHKLNDVMYRQFLRIHDTTPHSILYVNIELWNSHNMPMKYMQTIEQFDVFTICFHKEFKRQVLVHVSDMAWCEAITLTSIKIFSIEPLREKLGHMQLKFSQMNCSWKRPLMTNCGNFVQAILFDAFTTPSFDKLQGLQLLTHTSAWYEIKMGRSGLLFRISRFYGLLVRIRTDHLSMVVPRNHRDSYIRLHINLKKHIKIANANTMMYMYIRLFHDTTHFVTAYTDNAKQILEFCKSRIDSYCTDMHGVVYRMCRQIQGNYFFSLKLDMSKFV